VEAAQQGVASVISNRSGAAEVLKHSLQADFWDTDKFANYLFALLQYSKLKNLMESESRCDVREITWDRTANKILNVYQALIKT
jgi:glycosyltransferase involved in cell wall biosynthesis